MDDRAPAIGKASFTCPHCGSFAMQRWYKLGAAVATEAPTAYSVERIDAWLANARKEADSEDDRKAIKSMERFRRAVDKGDPAVSTDDGRYMPPLHNANVSLCFACDREALWVAALLVYPEPVVGADPPNPDLPLDIRRDYLEAADVLSKSPRATAALLRLAIQKLCEILVDEPDDINKMIGELVRKGLNPLIQQALDAVRVIGNEAVHPGTLDLRDDTDTAARLFRLVNIIAEAMISHPKHVGEVYAMIPEHKLKGIQDRDRPKQIGIRTKDTDPSGSTLPSGPGEPAHPEEN